MSEKKCSFSSRLLSGMNNKDLTILEKYLHSDVRFVGPLADLKGKDAVLNSVKHFLAFFNTLTIRAQFGAGDQTMLVYDLDCPAPVGHVREASLLTFQEDLIIRYELFCGGPDPLKRKRTKSFEKS